MGGRATPAWEGLKIERVNANIRYEPDDRCPRPISLGVAAQGVMLALANTVLFVTVTAGSGGGSEDWLAWAIFSSLAIGGIVTALQAHRAGRFGAGHVLMTGAGPHFIAVAVLAMAAGGLPMMASLIVLASLVQFALAGWYPLLRRVITPAVSGTALMLIAVTVTSIAIDRIGEAPQGAPSAAGPIVAVTTLAIAAALALRASGIWRLWAPLIGIASGCAVAAGFGMYDAGRVADARWFYVPDAGAWPGFDLSPGPEFWSLLPAFLIVSLVVGIKMSSDAVAIQRVSRVRPRATDFRVVQSAVTTNALGSMLAGIAGTLPTISYTPSVVTLITFTGVAARSVGYAIGGFLVVLAFLPKPASVLLAIPSPVMGAFLLIVMGLLFMEGVRLVAQDRIDHRKAVVVGLAITVGVGIESQNILAELLGRNWGAPLGNGLTLGMLVAILLSLFIELTSPRQRRLETTLGTAALPEIDGFLRDLAQRMGWNEASTDRLRAAGEETLSSLMHSVEGADAGGAAAPPPGDGDGAAPRLLVSARRDDEGVELEFLAVSDGSNIEDRLAHISEESEAPEEHEISFWLLRHYASSVRHRKYHGIDIVTVHVEGSR